MLHVTPGSVSHFSVFVITLNGHTLTFFILLPHAAPLPVAMPRKTPRTLRLRWVIVMPTGCAYSTKYHIPCRRIPFPRDLIELRGQGFDEGGNVALPVAVRNTVRLSARASSAAPSTFITVPQNLHALSYFLSHRQPSCSEPSPTLRPGHYQ